MAKAPSRTESSGPTGFQLPTGSTQETGHGYQDMNVSDNDPFSAPANEPQSIDGYGAEDAPAAQGEADHQLNNDGYSSKLH